MAGGGRAVALEPDEIALVVNSAEPIGKELAQFYALQRHIPDNRILELDNVPKTDEMSTHDFEESVVPQVREFLKSGHLEKKIKCLVTFYGVPLRIAARVNTRAEDIELGQLQRLLIELPDRMRPHIEAVEAIAAKLDPAFVPQGSGTDLTELQKRYGAASQSVARQVQTIPDLKQRGAVEGEFFTAAAPLMGKLADIDKLKLDLVSRGTTRPSDLEPLQAMASDYNKTVDEAGRYEQLPYDAQARVQLRDLANKQLGILAFLNVLRDQADYLTVAQSASAFDNELAMGEWIAYPHKNWIPNPLYYQVRAKSPQQTLMVARLDAPTPDIVKSMITTSIKVEQEGLNGKVVIDSLGVKTGEESPDQKGYGVYDQYLRNLDKMLRGNTKLDIMLDEKPEVLPAGSATDVALYCGWHAARNYTPACKFSPGAVGYHIASYELISLRGPNESGWVHGLLTDGIVGTLGPVAEPYLAAFPRPDEFFPLVLTGKLTMAEVYWKTEPFTSWMIGYLGDPLYTPYKKNPKLQKADLPFRLRAALDKTP
jgi:uncharacterized protein (TIGR03790 family)